MHESLQRNARTHLPLLGHCFIQRIFGVWCAQQCLYTEEDGSNLQGGAPVVLQHVQAYSPQSIDVRMIDSSEEADLGGGHGVVVGEEELEVEYATCGEVGQWAGCREEESCVVKPKSIPS